MRLIITGEISEAKAAARDEYRFHDNTLVKNKTGLEQGPVDDENKAEDKEGDRNIETAVLINYWQLADPSLPGSYPKHTHKGPVKLQELDRCSSGEEVHPQDGICPLKQRRGRWRINHCAVSA